MNSNTDFHDFTNFSDGVTRDKLNMLSLWAETIYPYFEGVPVFRAQSIETIGTAKYTNEGDHLYKYLDEKCPEYVGLFQTILENISSNINSFLMSGETEFKPISDWVDEHRVANDVLDYLGLTRLNKVSS